MAFGLKKSLTLRTIWESPDWSMLSVGEMSPARAGAYANGAAPPLAGGAPPDDRRERERSRSSARSRCSGASRRSKPRPCLEVPRT